MTRVIFVVHFSCATKKGWRLTPTDGRVIIQKRQGILMSEGTARIGGNRFTEPIDNHNELSKKVIMTNKGAAYLLHADM